MVIPFAQSGTVTFTITPQGGFTGSVSFSCGTLPAYFSCNFAASSVALTASSGAVTNTLTINTAKTSTASAAVSGSRTSRILAATFWLPASAGLLFFGRRKRRNAPLARIWMLALLCIGLVGTAAMSGCGGRSDQEAPDGSYSIPVNFASPGVASQTVNVAVHVQ
jgi:hypothetical protein